MANEIALAYEQRSVSAARGTADRGVQTDISSQCERRLLKEKLEKCLLPQASSKPQRFNDVDQPAFQLPCTRPRKAFQESDEGAASASDAALDAASSVRRSMNFNSVHVGVSTSGDDMKAGWLGTLEKAQTSIMSLLSPRKDSSHR